MSKIKRALLIGFGSAGKKHLDSINQIRPGLEVILLRRQKSIKKKIEKGFSFIVDTIKDALELKPDFAIVSNPSPFHLEVAMPLVKEGVHLFIEKPLSSKIDGVEDLINASIKSKSLIMIGYNLRFLPSLLKFKEYLDQGRVGKILSVRSEVGQNLAEWRPQFDYRESVSARKSLGGGVLLELCHEIDYLLWIFGNGKASWIYSFLTKKSGLEIDVEDCAYIQLGLGRDKGNEEIVASLNLDFFRHDKTRYCLVIGDKGSLRWDGINGELELFSINGKKYESLLNNEPNHLIKIEDTYKEELKHFFNCIENNITPLVSVKEGYEVMKVIEAARLSNLERRVIDIKN